MCIRDSHIVDEKVIKRFSPWNLVERESIVVRGRPQTHYSIFGIVMLDYLDLYKKFIPTRQESYKLDFIGELELGRGKDDNGYDTFKEWYTKDFQSFVDYNNNLNLAASTATFENGLLVISIPPVAEKQAFTIEIQ